MSAYGWARFIFLILLMAFLAGCSGAGEGVDQWKELAELREVSGRVSRVTYSETFSLNRPIRCVVDGRIKDISRVRYIGIDTPEKNEPFYHSAIELNKSLVHGKRVKLIFDKEKIDGYDRLLAYVYVGDLFVNAEMVRRGYARASSVKPNVRYTDLFQSLEAEAKEKKLGIWSIPVPEQTVKGEDQIGTPVEGEYRFVASESSGVFHVPSCRWAKEITSGKVYFQTYKEAVESGRKPCKVCKPEGAPGHEDSNFESLKTDN